MSLKFKKFMRKPFIVEALEVTPENIEQIADMIGTLRTEENGTTYIQTNRNLIPVVFKVYAGFWVTKRNGKIRCYSPRTFDKQFIETEEAIDLEKVHAVG